MEPELICRIYSSNNLTILTKIRGSMLWPVSSKSSNEANITTATSTILFHYPKIDFSFVLTKVSKLESRYNVIELKGEANIYVRNNQGPLLQIAASIQTQSLAFLRN